MASPMENPNLTPLDVARFWSKVDVKKELDCWLWKSTEAANGYGEFRLDSKTIKAHRIAYFLMHGKPLKPENVVMHRCDVKLCVNPLHLLMGTTKDNLRDCKAKRRNAFGWRNGMAKLTDDQAMDIRFAPMLARELAAKHGISIHSVYAIRRSNSWKHLPANKAGNKGKHWRRTVSA